MEELFDHLKSDELVFPLQFDLQQAHIYCDPDLVLEEGCCEILPGGVSSWLPSTLLCQREGSLHRGGRGLMMHLPLY